MLKKILFIVLIFSMLLKTSAFAEKVYTNEDLEKYKSKRDKQMTEEDKIKESERKQKYKHKEIEMEEKMWRSTPMPGEKKQKVIIERE